MNSLNAIFNKNEEILNQEKPNLTKKKVKAIKALALDFEDFSAGTIDDEIYE